MNRKKIFITAAVLVLIALAYYLTARPGAEAAGITAEVRRGPFTVDRATPLGPYPSYVTSW